MSNFPKSGTDELRELIAAASNLIRTAVGDPHPYPWSIVVAHAEAQERVRQALQPYLDSHRPEDHLDHQAYAHTESGRAAGLICPAPGCHLEIERTPVESWTQMPLPTGASNIGGDLDRGSE